MNKICCYNCYYYKYTAYPYTTDKYCVLDYKPVETDEYKFFCSSYTKKIINQNGTIEKGKTLIEILTMKEVRDERI